MAAGTLQSGNGFYLMPNGNWGVKEIPANILKDAKFFGYLTIQGYKCTVFETPSGEQWAQKSSGTMATRNPKVNFIKLAARLVAVASQHKSVHQTPDDQEVEITWDTSDSPNIRAISARFTGSDQPIPVDKLEQTIDMNKAFQEVIEDLQSQGPDLDARYEGRGDV